MHRSVNLRGGVHGTARGSESHTHRQFLTCPAGSCNYQQGVPQAEAKGKVLTPAAILAQMPEESKSQNDVPFLLYRMREGRQVRTEQASNGSSASNAASGSQNHNRSPLGLTCGYRRKRLQ